MHLLLLGVFSTTKCNTLVALRSGKYTLIETMPNALTCHEHSLFDEADEAEQCNNFHSFQWHYQELSLTMRILQTRYMYLLTVSISLSNH